MRLLTWPVRWFAAHDVFIAYARQDARAYAKALAERLEAPPDKLSVAFDQLVSLPGEATPKEVLRKARWSRSRVVLVTPAALGSTEIAKELAEFEHYPAPVVPVLEPGVDRSQAVWREHLRGLEDRVVESGGRAAFTDGKPAEAVYAGVRQVIRFMRRERRIAAAAIVGVAIAGGGTAAGAYYSLQAVKASQQAVLARAAAASAATQARRASEAEAKATAEAASASRLAEARKLEADVAETRAAEARLAGEASALSADANDLLIASPARQLEALQIATRSMEMVETVSGNVVLRRLLALTPPLLADIHTGCAGDKAAYDPHAQWLVTGNLGRLCVVDVRGKKLLDPLNLGSLDSVEFLAPLGDGMLFVVILEHGRKWPSAQLLLPARKWQSAAKFPLQTQVTAVALAPDGRHIAIGTNEGLVGLIERPEGGEWQPGNYINALGAHNSIRQLLFDRGGDNLLVGSSSALEVIGAPLSENPHRVNILRVGEKALPFLVETTPAVPDFDHGRLFAAFAGALRSFEFPKLIPIQEHPQTGIDSLHMDAKGRLLVHTAEQAFTSYGFGRDGQFVVQTTRDRTKDQLPVSGELSTTADGTHFWAVGIQSNGKASWASLRNTARGEEVGRIVHETYIRHLFPADQGNGVVSVSGDDNVRIWGDVMAANMHTWHGGGAIASAGVDWRLNRMVAAFGSPPRIERWQLSPMAVVDTVAVPDRVVSMRLVGGSGVMDLFTDSGWWRLDKGSVELALQLAAEPPSGRCNKRVVAWGKGEADLVVNSGEGELRVVRNRAWHTLRLPGVNACIEALAVDPELRYAAVSASVRVRQATATVAPSRSGIFVFALESGTELFRIPTPYLVRSMAFDGTGRLLAVGGARRAGSRFTTGQSELQVYALPEGNPVAATPVDGGDVFSVICISPDGRRLASEGDAIARVWQLDTAAGTMKPLTSQTIAGAAIGCSFSDDGRRLAIADRDGLRVMLLDRDDMVAAARRRLDQSAERGGLRR